MEYDNANAYVVRIGGRDVQGGVFATATIEKARELVEEQVAAAGIDTSNEEWYEIGGRLHYRAPADIASIIPLTGEQAVTLVPGTDNDAQLPVEHRGDTLRIDTSEAAIEQINDVAHERNERAEITYLIALRKVIRHAQAPWFDAEAAIDHEPVEPATIDEEAVEAELKELEEELEDEKREGTGIYADGESADTIDKDALGEELRDIEQNQPTRISDDLSDDELRELLSEIRRETEAFRAAMEIDTSQFLQGDEE